jgi:hypothetical protein
VTDFELMKAILEKAECEEDIYFAPDDSEINIEHGVTILFHPEGTSNLW